MLVDTSYRPNSDAITCCCFHPTEYIGSQSFNKAGREKRVEALLHTCVEFTSTGRLTADSKVQATQYRSRFETLCPDPVDCQDADLPRLVWRFQTTEGYHSYNELINFNFQFLFLQFKRITRRIVPKLLRITTVPISLHLLLAGQFRYMREQGFDVYTMSATGAEVEDVVKEGVPHIAVPFTRKITPFQDLRCLFQLMRFIRRERPDIIHTHTPKAGLLGMLAARICNVPMRLHTVAGLPLMEASGLKRRVLELTEAITYACATKVYPNSAGLKRFIEKQFGISAPKLRIIAKGSSNGIDTDYFSITDGLKAEAQAIRSKHHIGSNHLVFCFIGRVVRDKGIVELVQAFRSLRDERRKATQGDNSESGSGMKLLIVGHFEEDLDPLPADVMQFLQRDTDVIMAGFQRDVRSWLLASDVFVFPSYREGFPNVVMQASLLEIPSIVSDINGCNEIITAHENGLIVSPKNANALAAAMKQLADDSSMRLQYGKAAREFVASNFSRRVVWEGLLGEYRNGSI